VANKKRTIKLVVSPDKKPAIRVKPGTKLEVIGVKLLSPTNARAKALGARLCGGSGTCLALHEV
jgi:hypothetical protein